MAAACGDAFAQQVPLPRLRPSIAPAPPLPLVAPAIPLPRPRPAIPLPDDVAAEPPPPTDCQLRMTPDFALAEIIPPVTGADSCGIDDAVRLSAVMTKDKTRVA